jgi:uncharacterized protein (DUF885 family)
MMKLSFLLLVIMQVMHSADSLEPRRQALKNALADEWEYELRESPEAASTFGDYRYNDKWSDISLAHVPQRRKDAKAFLDRFEAIDTTGFTEQEKISKQLIVEKYEETLEDIDFKNYLMPVDQFNGIQIMLPQIVSAIPLDSVKHYEDYLARLRQIPRVLADTEEVLKQGEKEKLMPPKFLLEKTVGQCESIADAAGDASAFAEPIKKFPASISAAEKKRLRAEILAAIDGQVRPAYTRLAQFIKTDYAPKGRLEPGLWSLPDGDARYRYDVRVQTTTGMTPEAIHELGLQQVRLIEGQMTAIASKLGFADLKAFRASLVNNPKVTPKSRDQILQLYRGYIADMQPKLPQLFGLLPKARVEVLPTQPYREAEAAGAEYNEGTPDGSRPGRVYVNTSDFAHRSLLDVEATAYHEGIPGHHMQISIAQELTSLPPFRQHAQYNAYVEGWALYAEQLGKELGFYQDPYSDYGRLTSDLFRACRLVIDTGVHYKHWTRQQMVDFFHEHSDESEPDLQAEVDRYIAYPAQALSYKLGQLKIIELRERAKKELGAKFDIRAFHDEILNGGALPLDVLEGRVGAWIAKQKG